MTREEVLTSHGPLTDGQIKRVDFDQFLVEEIVQLAERGIVDIEDVNDFYGNEWRQKGL